MVLRMSGRCLPALLFSCLFSDSGDTVPQLKTAGQVWRLLIETQDLSVKKEIGCLWLSNGVQKNLLNVKTGSAVVPGT